MEHQHRNARRLKEKIRGEVITSEDAGYCIERLNWNHYTSHYPTYIVYPECTQDIVTCIKFCRVNKIPFRVRGNHSHSLGYDFSSVNDGLVCNMKNFNSMKIKSHNRVVIGSGNILGNLVYGLAQAGYMFPYGDIFGVGIGFVLGGGIGLQNKQMGLACDNLLGCELITAQGDLIKVDDKHNEDLFLALRGGGSGNFGVITSMTLRYQEAPKLVCYINIVWRNANLETIREIIVEWMNIVSSSAKDINLCRRLEITKENIVDNKSSEESYRAVVTCIVYYNDESLFKFRSIGKYIKTIEIMSYNETVHAMLNSSVNDVHSDLNFKFLGYFANKILDSDTVDILIDYFKKNNSDIFFLEFGGKFNKSKDATAFYWRDAMFYFEVSKIWPVYKHDKILYHKRGHHKCKRMDEKRELNIPDFASYREVAHELSKRYKSGYINVPNNTYTDPKEYEKFYYGENRQRLKAIKSKYDPHNFFNFSQSIQGS